MKVKPDIPRLNIVAFKVMGPFSLALEGFSFLEPTALIDVFVFQAYINQ